MQSSLHYISYSISLIETYVLRCKKKVHVENTESKNKVQTKDISLLNVNENKTINPVDKVLEAIPSSHKYLKLIILQSSVI